MSEKQSDNAFLMISKGVILTILVTLICVLVFTFIVKVAALGDGAIKVINQFLKIFSLFLGVWCFVKGKRGLIKGLLVGVVSTLLIYLIFGFISADKISTKTLFIEMLFSAIVGGLCGIIAVNRKKHS